MKKAIVLFGTMLFAGAFLLSGCDKGGDNKPVDATGILYNGEEIANNATITVKYGEDVDLNTLFKLTPRKAEGSLKFTLVEQPAYIDVTTGETAQEVIAWQLSGSTLKTLARVPDALNEGTRLRQVFEGKLRVEIIDGVELSPIEVYIAQSDKPAITEPPVVVPLSRSGYEEVEDGNLYYEVIAEGQTVYFNPVADYFMVLPLDYDPAGIVRRPSPDAQYIGNTDNGPRIVASRDTEGGEGEYVLGFYCTPKAEGESDAAYEARVDAAYEAAVAAGKGRIYVDLIPGNKVVGIELSPGIGTTGAASFWKSGRKLATAFIVMKLADGTTRPYDSSSDSPLGFMAGEVDNIVGHTDVPDHNGWFTYIQPVPVITVGEEFKFTITSKIHKLEPEWTVRVESEYLAANPEVVE